MLISCISRSQTLGMQKITFTGSLTMFKLEFHFTNNKIEGGALIATLLIIALVIVLLVK